MQATPPTMNAHGAGADGEQGLQLHLQRRLGVHDDRTTRTSWHITPWNFLPRFGAVYNLGGDQVVRFAYAATCGRYSNVRDTLGDFVNQYTGYAQTTNTLGLANGVPQQTLANPYPADQPGHRAVRPGLRPLHGPRRRRQPRPVRAAAADQRPLQPLVPAAQIWGGIVIDVSYFFNYGTRVPYDINLNMMDPAFRYEQKTRHQRAGGEPVPQLPDAGQVPRRAAQHRHRDAAAACSCPYPQYGAHHADQHQRRDRQDAHASSSARSGRSSRASASWPPTPTTTRSVQEWFDDLAQYKVLTTGGKDGWEWRPTADVPDHRFTAAVTWQLPVGKDRQYGSTMPTALDYVIGGWQYSARDAHVFGPAAAVHHELRRHGQPEARQPDPRQVVRHVDVRAWPTRSRRAATRTTTTA